MTPKKVAIENAIRPAAPSERIVADVVIRCGPDLSCSVVKIEYGEVTGEDTVSWRAILKGQEAVDFEAAWILDKAAAVADILKNGELRSERH